MRRDSPSHARPVLAAPMRAEPQAPTEAELSAPMIAIHRARLQEVLQEALGPEPLALGA